MTAPDPLELVQVPFEVAWSAPAGSRASRYAVMVDWTPPPPGASLRSLARRVEDDVCLSRPTCPDNAWLEARGIFVVQGDRAVVTGLRTVGGRSTNGREFHRLVVVELDAAGRRLGEAGGVVEFTVAEAR